VANDFNNLLQPSREEPKSPRWKRLSKGGPVRLIWVCLLPFTLAVWPASVRSGPVTDEGVHHAAAVCMV
jgi:hypothetical protein